LLILVWHYGVLQLLKFPVMGGWLKTPLGLAWSGVDLFFVLSGFLIGGILMDHRESASFFKTFYIRRSCRILPIYFIMVALFAVAVWFLKLDTVPRLNWVFGAPYSPLTYATFTQTAPIAATGLFGPGWLAVSWSLAIEEHFYLVLPLLICLCRPQTLPYLLGSLILLAPMLRLLFSLVLTDYSYASFVLMPCRADSLALGALAAWAVRRPAFVENLRANPRGLRLLLAAFAAGAVVLALTGRRFSSPVMSLFGYSWLAGFYSLVLLACLHHSDGWIARICRARWLQWLGVMSYGVYLFHQPISGLCHAALRGTEPGMTNLIGVAATSLALLITLLVAWLSFRYVEKPILNFGHRYQYDSPAPARPASTVPTEQTSPLLLADEPVRH